VAAQTCFLFDFKSLKWIFTSREQTVNNFLLTIGLHGPVNSANQVFHDEQWLTATAQAENLQRTPCDHWGLNE